MSPEDVDVFPNAKLYDPSVLRTLFLDFDSSEWEEELADFKPTDVEVPCKLTVDGKTYPDVGASFRGASSFFMIPAGSKRSLNLSIDFANEDQRLYGYKTLNLLNCNGDASLMSSFLYADIAGKKIATPQVNFVKVVINGRNWGVYANVQQFNKDFLKENYGTKKGARWKVSGNPNADGGLRYTGEDLTEYRDRYEIKSKDEEKPWNDLVNLTKLIAETPAKDIDRVLEPHLDLDGVMWFLAVDVALVNSDGYWTRASDYSIYQGKDSKFHILPHDMNEAFRPRHGRGGPGGGGPGGGGPGGGGPGGGGPGGGRGPFSFFFGPGGGEQPGQEQPGQAGNENQLSPLVGLDNERMPLRSKLLANENLRRKYLENMEEIANKYLDWKYLGQKVGQARLLIKSEVERDTRKLMTNDAFLEATDPVSGSLKTFCDDRSDYLMEFDAIKALHGSATE